VAEAASSKIMTRRRWIADEFSDNHAALVGAHAEHLAVVLRARVGQSFEIVAGDRPRSGRVTSVHPNRVEFELGEELPHTTSPQISLLMAIFKFDRMEWAIEKCTELGAARIIPVIARRTDAHLARAAGARVERWRRIAKQASEQSRRTVPPDVDVPFKLSEAAKLTAGTRIVLAESEKKILLKEALASHLPTEEVLLALGPEGGWSEDELSLFSKTGWVSASLGDTILRAETAAIAATSIAFAELA
jgi:16S rRNA (uracil1498-N3)-methyltransferase